MRRCHIAHAACVYLSIYILQINSQFMRCKHESYSEKITRNDISESPQQFTKQDNFIQLHISKIIHNN